VVTEIKIGYHACYAEVYASEPAANLGRIEAMPRDLEEALGRAFSAE